MEYNNLIDNYLHRDDWRVKENSNMTYSLQGMNFYLSSLVTSQYWLDKIYTPSIKDAHEKGQFHIHDLGILGVYCVGWDLQALLIEGFTGVRGKITSSPAKHFRSALGQLVNFMYSLQGECAGAQAVSNFDTLLAPFIRYDGLNYKQVKQALQEFVFNMNVPTRVGFQTVFSNVSMDLKPPSYLRDEPVTIGGQLMDETYGEFQEEMDLFNQAFAEVMAEGDGVNRVFTFPIPTYNITENFDWDNPSYDKIWEMTARYGIPYFSNFIGSDMDPEDARSMCCRLRLDNRELRRRGGGLFGSNPLTGSIGVVTINMARLGLETHTEQGFFSKLASVMDLARDSLEIKRKALEELTESGLYPYSKFYLRAPRQQHGEYWHNHFSTIGLIAMNEACRYLLKCSIADPEGQAFSIRVLQFMRDRLAAYQEETGNLYNLEATPAEGCSYSLWQKDHEQFNIDVPFYTNSTQLPVDHTDDLWEALQNQEPLQENYTGGTVFHVFLGEAMPSSESVKSLLKKMCRFKIPYYSFTPSFSICPEHGYLIGEQPKCPHCAKDTEVYSRVVGYLRPMSQYNIGKQKEFAARKKFDKAI